jgi:hypothetical protein
MVAGLPQAWARVLYRPLVSASQVRVVGVVIVVLLRLVGVAGQWAAR